MPDSSVKYLHIVAHALKDGSGDIEFVGAVMDVTAAKLAEDELHKAQAELTYVTRVTSLGDLTASVAHEVNQPLAALVTNGEACLYWFHRNVPELDEARRAV
jgi:C4-dicarboxylate-specific signal transduction histidine kinase